MSENFDPKKGSLSLAEILHSPLTDEDKAIACLARLGLRESDDENLRFAALTYALLAVAFEISLP